MKKPTLEAVQLYNDMNGYYSNLWMQRNQKNVFSYREESKVHSVLLARTYGNKVTRKDTRKALKELETTLTDNNGFDAIYDVIVSMLTGRSVATTKLKNDFIFAFGLAAFFMPYILGILIFG